MDEFKPLGFGDVFERAFKIMGRNWKTFGMISRALCGSAPGVRRTLHHEEPLFTLAAGLEQ